MIVGEPRLSYYFYSSCHIDLDIEVTLPLYEWFVVCQSLKWVYWNCLLKLFEEKLVALLLIV